VSAVLAGVLPVFALIALGWGLKAGGFMPAATWAPVERLTYFVFYPGFLIPAIWAADFGGSAGALGLATIGAVSTLGGIAIAVRRWLPLDGPAFTSVFQGVTRWNSFVFLPVVALLFGDEALGPAAVVLGALIPFVNVASVLVLSKWGAGQGGGWGEALRSLLRNPVLWACTAGGLLNASGLRPTGVLNDGLELVSAAALPLGLLVAGSGLDFANVRARPRVIAGVSVVKLLVLPLLMWGYCRALGGDELAQGLALTCGSAPGAAASYVLARQMGGDAPLMAGIVAFTTVAALVTLPLVLGLAHLA
jgi:predicted permease